MESPVRKLRGEVNSLKQKKDELKVQTYLFSAEVKKQLANFEKDWRIVSRALREMGFVFSKSAENISHDTEPLLKEVRNFYGRVMHDIKEQNTNDV